MILAWILNPSLVNCSTLERSLSFSDSLCTMGMKAVPQDQLWRGLSGTTCIESRGRLSNGRSCGNLRFLPLQAKPESLQRQEHRAELKGDKDSLYVWQLRMLRGGQLYWILEEAGTIIEPRSTCRHTEAEFVRESPGFVCWINTCPTSMSFLSSKRRLKVGNGDIHDAIPAFRRLKQRDCELKASLGYCSQVISNKTSLLAYTSVIGYWLTPPSLQRSYSSRNPSS